MQAVKKRHVLYIPGYDPFPPRRYRELYRKESAAQAAISGYRIRQTASSDKGRFGWAVELEDKGAVTVAQIDVLVWADLVQRSMGQSIVETYRQLFLTAWIYISSGALWRLMKLRKGPVIAALYPVVFLLLQAFIAIGMAYLVGTITYAILPIVAVAWMAAGLIFYGVLRGFRRFDHRFFAYYLMHDYAFTAQEGGAYPNVLETRLAAFRADIQTALAEDVDEVLIVGHSSGAYLAVSVLADVVREGLPEETPALSLLTLGHVVPMASFLPKAQRLRGDLAYLSSQDALTWIDVTAPGDGCAFALCDPVAVSGVARDTQKWPIVISAAFSQTLGAERWQQMKRRYFKLHFQYLCAFACPRDYDYFQITAGAQTLASRFGDRKPSPSTLRRPVNKYTDIAQ